MAKAVIKHEGCVCVCVSESVRERERESFELWL